MTANLHNNAIKQSDDTPVVHNHPRHMPSTWAIRGMLSTAGQTLVLISGLKSAKNGTDRGATIGFATVNLLANAINILFGAQKKQDKHQLRYLEEQINAQIAPLAKDASALPSVGAEKGNGTGDSWISKHSVTVSEVGLRTLGSLSLIAPITGWGKAFSNWRGGMSLAETFSKARSQNKVTYYAGMFSLAGKFFTVAASEPDPYNPAPMTKWRAAREKWMFRLSSISEATAGAWMSYDAFTQQKIAKPLRTRAVESPALADPAYFNTINSSLIKRARPYTRLDDAAAQETRQRLVDMEGALLVNGVSSKPIANIRYFWDARNTANKPRLVELPQFPQIRAELETVYKKSSARMHERNWMPNYYGGIGNALFDVGYVARWLSPYGTREVDMAALYAHTAKAIATLPEENRAPMLEKISKDLAAHFSAKGIEAATISAAITKAMDHQQPSTKIARETVSHTPPEAKKLAL